MYPKSWNEDIAYAFSIHKAGLSLVGGWPLSSGYSSKLVWFLVNMSQWVVIVGLVLELAFHGVSGGATMEIILLLEITLIILIKHISLALFARRLRTVINSAVDDWLLSLQDKGTWKKMKAYARIGRTLTLIMLYFGGCATVAYVLGSLAIDRKPPFEETTNKTVGLKSYIFPVVWTNIAREWTDVERILNTATQAVQAVYLTTEQCVMDCFFFNIVMHLAGQINILKAEFLRLGQRNAIKANCDEQLILLVKRHCYLMQIVHNLQTAFNAILFAQMSLSAVLIAIAEYSMILSLRQNNTAEFMKGFLLIGFILMQCFLYVYAADFLTAQSEKIFHAIYEITWYKFPRAFIRDLTFIMMRTRIPIQLSGGSFFYVSRTTMTYIIKAAASYVSVLQVTIKD